MASVMTSLSRSRFNGTDFLFVIVSAFVVVVVIASGFVVAVAIVAVVILSSSLIVVTPLELV